MKPDIHPPQVESKVICGSCGHTFVTLGTQLTIETELCSKCHPFFTGKQVLIDTAGQVDRFRRKLQVASDHQAKQPPKPKKAAAAAVKEEKPPETNEQLLARIKQQLIEDDRKKQLKKSTKSTLSA